MFRQAYIYNTPRENGIKKHISMSTIPVQDGVCALLIDLDESVRMVMVMVMVMWIISP